MDCNNFSYVNMNSKYTSVAEYGDDDKLIILDYIVNYFQEKYYRVMDLFGDICEDFETLDAAKTFYNTLVPASARIA